MRSAGLAPRHRAHLGPPKTAGGWNHVLRRLTDQSGVRVVVARDRLDVESIGSSWGLVGKAALLGVSTQELLELSAAEPRLTQADPQCFFVAKQVAATLGVPLAQALSLVLGRPHGESLTQASLEELLEGLAWELRLPRQQVAALLVADPGLLHMPLAKVLGEVRRLCARCGVPREAACSLALLAPAVRFSEVNQSAHEVASLASMLAVTPAQALEVLRVEQEVFGDGKEVLVIADYLLADWKSFAARMGTRLKAIMPPMIGQLTAPRSGGGAPRYSLRSLALLEGDVAALAQGTGLPPSAALAALLGEPRVATDVPACVLRLLGGYVFGRAPAWQQQLAGMAPGEAGRLLLALAVEADTVSLTDADDLFATADVDYARDVQLVAQVAGDSLAPPRQVPASPDPAAAGSGGGGGGGHPAVRAAQVWRLVYLCNPRLSGACLRSYGDLEERRAAAGGGGGEGELVPCLLEALEESTDEFCARHPRYAHWLSNTMFTLDWAREAQPAAATWSDV